MNSMCVVSLVWVGHGHDVITYVHQCILTRSPVYALVVQEGGVHCAKLCKLYMCDTTLVYSWSNQCLIRWVRLVNLLFVKSLVHSIRDSRRDVVIVLVSDVLSCSVARYEMEHVEYRVYVSGLVYRWIASKVSNDSQEHDGCYIEQRSLVQQGMSGEH